MTAPSPSLVTYELEAQVLENSTGDWMPLDVANITPSVDMDRVPYTEAILELRNVDERLWRALDPRVIAVPFSSPDVRFRVHQYSAEGVWQQSMPAVDAVSFGAWGRGVIRDASRSPIARTATIRIGGRETLLDDKRRIAGTVVDTGATTVSELVMWSLTDVFGSYGTYGADSAVLTTTLPAGERRKMLQGQTHGDLLQTELDAIGCRLYDYWGQRWYAGARETPAVYVGAPQLVRLATFSGRGAVTLENTYSAWATQRVNLWANPRAVAGGTAFAAPSSGSASYVTDMTGDIATARRWTASGTGNTRIIALPLGIATPDQGERAHVMMRIRITGGSLSVARLNVRPSDIGSSTNATVQDFGTLAAGVHELELRLNTNAMTANPSAGVVLTGAASVAGVTVDATAILVETVTDGEYFDGEGPDDELAQQVWAGDAHQSFSWEQTRTITGTYEVPAPSTLPADVDAIVLDVQEQISRDSDFADGVLVKGDFVSSTGVRTTWYQASGSGANTRGRVVNVERPQPAGNVADQYVKRTKLRGQTFDIVARNRFDVLPGMSLQLFTRDGILPFIIRAVQWDISAGEMRISGMTGTPV
jgi:hypothetical protein